MFTRITIAVLLLLTFSCSAPKDRGIVKREGKADIFLVEADDPEIVHAITQARRTVPSFLAALRDPKPNQESFAVKYPFKEGEQVEHMWVEKVSYDGSVLRGVLNNYPERLRNLEADQPVEVSPAEVSDWMYVEDGRLIGGYTMRVTFRRYTPTEKREVEESLGFKID